MTSGTRRSIILIPRFYGGNKASLCLRTKIFHWHMNEPDFRDYHLLLDEQVEQIFAITDDVGASVQDWRNTLPPISDMSHHQCSRTRIKNPLRRMKRKA